MYVACVRPQAAPAEGKAANADRRGNRAAEVEQVRRRIGPNLATAFKDIGKKSEGLKRHLALAIKLGFKEISYAPDADDRPERHH